jgi:tRNA-specific 2-thiouridylase
LGQHAGIHRVTIGQRKGLGISASRRLYVVDIEADSKRVVVGTKQELGCKGLIANNVNWIQKPDKGEIAAQVQIRYRSPAIPCVIHKMAEGACEVLFTSTLPAVTPGQAAVFYRRDQLLGGGWIEKQIT